MLNNEQMETINLFFEQIQKNKEITLHQVSVFLDYALQDVNNKSDLSDGELLTIKGIRSSIKGL